MDVSTFTNPLLRVNWNLGNTCTYKCSYCSAVSHDGTYPWPEFRAAAHAVRAIDRLYKREPYNKDKIVFELLGGEVTLWKELDKLLDVIQETGNLTMLVTNGVRTLDWWRANAGKFGWVTLSFHSEFADYKHITEVSNILADAGVGVGILVLMYPARWEYLVEAHDYFVKNSKANCISLQDLTLMPLSAEGTKHNVTEDTEWPYSPEHRDWLVANSHIENPREFINNYWLEGGMQMVKGFDPNSVLSVSSSYLSINGLNNWKGWDCYVGIDTLFLEQNGDIRRDNSCRVSVPFGNWKKDNLYALNWPKEPIRCPFKSCFCAHDYRARKENRNEINL